MTDSEQSDSPEVRRARTAANSARHIRRQWIDLSYALPDPAPPGVLGLWNQADDAMRQLAEKLEGSR